MKILAISLAYPPLAYPRSVQVARLLKHADVSAVMFCADEPGARLDSSIEPDAEEKLVACVRVTVPSPRISGLVDRAAYRFAPAVWRRRNHVPDRYGKWERAVLRDAARFIDDSGFRPDAVVSFAQPFTDHLIGRELSSRLNVPWLAHFSDPWLDNPFTPFDAATRSRNAELERSVAERADMLVFTSPETVDLFYEKYPRDWAKKARVLPHCYDPLMYRERDGQRPEKITVRYLGNFYGRRTPEPLISGLLELDRRRPGFLNDVSFELIGSGEVDEVTRLAESLPNGTLAVRPSVSYRASLELMTDSDGLLIIDAPAEVSVFLPSKLIDYLGARRPIFGITPRGTAASLISELGGLVADPADTVNISVAIERFVERLRELRAAPTADEADGNDEAVRSRYSTERVAAEFRLMLDELTERPR